MKEILEILKSMPIEERMEVLNTLREYLRQLEDENAKLKKLVADLSLDNMAQKEIIKKFCDPE